MTNKTKIFYIFFLIFSIGIYFTSNVFAEEKSSNLDVQAIIKTLQEQIKNLQAQIVELKSELEIVKVELKFSKTLARGLKDDDDVRQLQKFLKTFPDIYPEGLVTGYFGPLTEAAVKRFQEKQGIDPVGYVGPKTLAKLKDNKLVLDYSGIETSYSKI